MKKAISEAFLPRQQMALSVHLGLGPAWKGSVGSAHFYVPDTEPPGLDSEVNKTLKAPQGGFPPRSVLGSI